MKNFCEDLFFFFLESTCACVLGPWAWPRAFLSLASKVSVLGLGFFCVLGLEPCVLDSTSAVKYLLVCIHDTITDNEDIKLQMKYLCGTANWLKTNFAKSSKRVKNFSLKPHCTMFYASQILCKQYFNCRGDGGGGGGTRLSVPPSRIECWFMGEKVTVFGRKNRLNF